MSLHKSIVHIHVHVVLCGERWSELIIINSDDSGGGVKVSVLLVARDQLLVVIKTESIIWEFVW